MASRKRGTSVTGDLFTIEHPSLDLDAAFSSHVDVTFDGITHQVLSTAGIGGFSFANTTGEFSVGELSGFVVESIDTIATQAVHRHQAIVAGAQSALSVHGYDGPARLLELVAALEPAETPVGMVVHPDAQVDVTGTSIVALATPIGLVQITPLSTSVDRELPRWRGTGVEHGDLYGATLADQSTQLVLVTKTARAVLMASATTDPDTATEVMAQLAVEWRPA